MSSQWNPQPPSAGTAADGSSTEQPLNVILSLTPEPADVGGPLPGANEPPRSIESLSGTASVLPDSAPGLLLAHNLNEAATFPVDGTSPPMSFSQEEPAGTFGSGAAAQRGAPLQPGRGVDRLARWFSSRMLWLLVSGLALLFPGLFVSAWSMSAAGVIFPDWGLASLRIGFAAAILGGALLLMYLLIWQAKAQPTPVYGGLVGLLLVLIGAGGVLSATPLHRLQGRWLEGRGQYGLALAAYQASGDNLANSGDMARVSVEWAEQLSARQEYGDAVAQLEPVVRLYKGDTALAARARMDLIGDYLAWGDQARQQAAFRAALARYQALQKGAYCDAVCQTQAHAHVAQALLGLARQLASDKQYDEAITTYQQIMQSYGDTPEATEATAALTTPQTLTGYLAYADGTPAKHFQALLASQWSFNSTTQVFTLLGQQYHTQTDDSGLFVFPSVPVGATYMIAWVDTSGHAGTCNTTNHQPLYTVQMPPLRATDTGSINIECAS